MILCIGIYFLTGIVIAIVSGFYCATVYEKKLEPKEIMDAINYSGCRAGLNDVYVGLGLGGRVFFSVVSLAILPFIAIMFGFNLMRTCDRLVNEKERAEK